jgi:hypothetical protein
MKVEIIGHFKPVNGVQTYRINGDKEALYAIIDDCRKNEIRFDDTPIINPLRKGQWTMLLKIILKGWE